MSKKITAKEEKENAAVVETLEKEIANTVKTATDNIVEHQPQIGEAGWTDYVKSLLRKEEIFNGFPTCDGLRRAFHDLIGEIISCETKVDQVPNVNNLNRGTVTCTIKYWKHSDANKQSCDRFVYIISDAADVFSGNTDKPFCNFPISTAATMAEGRCLRKAMRLVKCLTVEEKSTANLAEQSVADLAVQTQPATPMHKQIIIGTCAKHDIDVDKLLNSMKNIQNKNLDNITYTEGQDIINLLTKYDNGPDEKGLSIPTEILKGE